jgi:beta-glucosidase
MENGMAAKDKVLPDGKIEDDDRLEYVKMHLSECKRAIDSGFNLKGYYYWSLMDNFEWTSGYSKRFGLVRVDYDTLKRTVKKSGGWYGEFIKGQKSI